MPDPKARRLAFTNGSITLCPLDLHRETLQSGRFLASPISR
jgi:hypothetical protein